MAAPTSSLIHAADRVPDGVRPARIDRPLGDHLFDPTYADERLGAVVRAAADEARTQARAEGYAQGWAEGNRQAEQHARAQRDELARAAEARQAQQREQTAAVVRTLTAAATAVRQADAAAWEAVADQLSAGAAAIVEALLTRELGESGSAALESARAALRTLGATRPTVAVHPTELEALRPALADAPEAPTLVADATVTPGAAVARRGDAQVLVDLPSALARITAELRG